MMLAYLTEEGWRPGLGDPGFMGWFTVFAYFAGALLCWKAARSVPGSEPAARQERWLWHGLLVFLAVLGVNKQLDLQTWFTIAAREMAMEQGWYERRRLVQFWFILGLAGLGLAGLAVCGWLVRSTLRRHLLTFAGAIFLGTFIVVRAASFHKVDLLLGWELGGIRMNWVLELGGIFLVGGSALWNWRKNRQVTPSRGQPGREFVWVTAPSRAGRGRKPQ